MRFRLSILALLLSLFASGAQAQTSTFLCTPQAGLQSCLQVSAGNPLPVSASVSASITGFPTTQSTGTPIAVTTSAGGVTGTLPTGAVVVAANVGTTNPAYCKLGASATTSDQYIAPSGGWFAFTVGASTQLTCISTGGTTTVNMVGGTGLPTGTGGGSGGGGGGGAITAASGSYASGALSSGSVASGAFASGSIASGAMSSGSYASGSIGSGAMVDLGAIADAAATTGSTGTLSAKLRLMTTQLNTLNTTLGSPFQAGGSVVQGNAGSNAQAWWTRIGDATNGPAAVKAASTAAVAADPALVVAMSPNVSYTFYTASATGTTGATTATLAGAASVTTYICGFSIRANATAAATGNATVTGTISATMNFTQWTAPNASGVGVTEEIFSPCIPASGANTSIAVVSAAPGSGGVVSVTAWGYKL